MLAGVLAVTMLGLHIVECLGLIDPTDMPEKPSNRPQLLPFQEFAKYLDSDDPMAVPMRHPSSVFEFLNQFDLSERAQLFCCIQMNYRKFHDSRIWRNSQIVLEQVAASDRTYIDSQLGGDWGQIDKQSLNETVDEYHLRGADQSDPPLWHTLIVTAAKTGIYSVVKYAVGIVHKRFVQRDLKDIVDMLTYVQAIPSPELETDKRMWSYFYLMLQKSEQVDNATSFCFLENPKGHGYWQEQQWIDVAARICQHALTLSKKCRSMFVYKSSQYRTFHLVLKEMEREEQIEILMEIVRHMMNTMLVGETDHPNVEWVKSLAQAINNFDIVEPVLERIHDFILSKEGLQLRTQALGIVYTVLFVLSGDQDVFGLDQDVLGFQKVPELLAMVEDTPPAIDFDLYRSWPGPFRETLAKFVKATQLPLYLQTVKTDFYLDEALRLAQNTPVTVQNRVRAKTLGQLNPVVWAAVFWEMTTDEIAFLGLDLFCDRVLEHMPEPAWGQYEAALRLMQFHDAPDAFDGIFDVCQMGRFLAKLEIPACMVETLMPTLLALFVTCLRRGSLQDPFAQFGAVFADAAASERFLLLLAERVHHGQADALLIPFLRYLACLHLKRDADFLLRLHAEDFDPAIVIAAWTSVFMPPDSIPEFAPSLLDGLVPHFRDLPESPTCRVPVMAKSMQTTIPVSHDSHVLNRLSHSHGRMFVYHDVMPVHVSWVYSQAEVDTLAYLYRNPVDNIVNVHRFIVTSVGWLAVVLGWAAGVPLDVLSIPDDRDAAFWLLFDLIEQTAKIFRQLDDLGIQMMRFDPRAFVYDSVRKHLTLCRLHDAVLAPASADVPARGHLQMRQYMRALVRRTLRKFGIQWFNDSGHTVIRLYEIFLEYHCHRQSSSTELFDQDALDTVPEDEVRAATDYDVLEQEPRDDPPDTEPADLPVNIDLIARDEDAISEPQPFTVIQMAEPINDVVTSMQQSALRNFAAVPCNVTGNFTSMLQPAFPKRAPQSGNVTSTLWQPVRPNIASLSDNYTSKLQTALPNIASKPCNVTSDLPTALPSFASESGNVPKSHNSPSVSESQPDTASDSEYVASGLRSPSTASPECGPLSPSSPDSDRMSTTDGSRRFHLIFMIVGGSTIIGTLALLLAKAKFHQDPPDQLDNATDVPSQHPNFIHGDSGKYISTTF